MRTDDHPLHVSVVILVLAAVFFISGQAFAHCDGMDGPVVMAARQALETGDVNPVLIWVQEKDEAEIRSVFRKTLAVRKLSPEAKDLADRSFFETLVRVHRAGEGEPYTGLKPAGRDLGPAIPAADRAVADGKLEPLFKLLTNKIHDGLHERFKEAMEKKNFKKDDLDAGRKYVEAYVLFLHYVEALYEAAAKSGGAHHHEPEEGKGHKH